MLKFTVTVELTSLGDLDKFHGAMRVAFGGPPTPIPASKTPAATSAPRPPAEVTLSPTAAPTPTPTAAPAAAGPAPDADGLVLDAGTPYEKSGLPALVTKAVANDRAVVIARLAKFGAKRGGDVKPEDWIAFAEDLKAIVAAGPKV